MVSVTKKMKAEKSRHTFALTRTAVLFCIYLDLFFVPIGKINIFLKVHHIKGYFYQPKTSLAVVIVWVLLQG